MSLNIAAYEENQRNKRHITVHASGPVKTIIVDGAQATYKGTKVMDLGREGKRKFENLVYLSNMANRERIKVVLK